MQLKIVVPALITIILLGGYSYYVIWQYNSLVDQYDSLVQRYNQAGTTAQNLHNTITFLRGELNRSSIVYNYLLRNYTRTNIVYPSPGSNVSIPIWGLPFDLRPGGWEQWELLDTFVNHLRFTANNSVRIMVMDLNNYVNFRMGSTYAPVVNMTGTNFSFNAYFTEGCGVYVLIVQNISNSTVLVQPNVSAIYSWTPFATGSCSFT
jgi:hypothetical protein